MFPLLSFFTGFATLIQGFLLLANAFAVLNEDRFLDPRGWTLLQIQGGRTTLKGKIIGLIHLCQFLRLPLIILNIIVIVFKLIFG
ncbi:protein transport protein yos1-like [Prunus dulcis]|uniref:protein transport protein yos1-like n=1 Tax=Prunus dulcis TaxID=3755 RepID=UPI00148223BC|nr:protein transport protein yos1-like [Prunus dulcis]XP_034218058.1 protein transport protein yos1-like [Prunus dulcis]